MPSKKRIRITDLPVLKPDAVSMHLDANYETFTEFHKKLRVNEAVNALASISTSFESVDVQHYSESFSKWRDTQSIPFYVPTIDSKQLAHLTKEKPVKTPTILPNTAEVPKKLESISFLDSKQFKYTLGIKSNEHLQGMNVFPYIDGLVNGNNVELEKSKATSGNGLLMYCGGPISSLTISPRADASGKEILAVSTFPDEINLFLPDSPSSYIQFWSFSSDLKSPAECKLLLEVPHCTILSMEWCPTLVNHKDKCLKTRQSKGQKSNNTCLGLLAVATDKGVVFVYSIPRKLPESKCAKGEVSIMRTKPVATLVHSSGYGTDHCIPIGTLKWSYYDGGNRLLGVSDAGGIMVWTLNTKPDKFKCENDQMPHMNGITEIYNPATSFSDSNWDSPPFDVSWLDSEQLLVTLRSRTVYIYAWPSMETTFVDSKSRGTGQALIEMPVLYDGCFCLDTAVVNSDGINYSGAGYLNYNDEDGMIQLPIFNRHQLQINDGAISPRTGIFTTVGSDGRLYQSMNARLTSHDDDENSRIFQYGKPLLHLIRLHRETEKENRRKVSIKHEECCQNTWMEVRAGDAALLDMLTVRKHKHLAADSILDRRTESLTRVSASTLTEGLVAAGGEAGLVFLMPTLL